MGIETIAAVGSLLSGVAGIGSMASGFMGGGGKPQAPQAVTATPNEPAKTPQQAQDQVRQKAAAAAGRGSTILTSPLGLTDGANTAKPVLLGR